MHIKKALKILSPLDVIVFQIREQSIVKKSELENFNFSKILTQKAMKFLSVGERPDRNPMLWNIVETRKIEEVQDLSDQLANALSQTKSYDVNLEDLDNNSQVATVTSEVSMLALNCKEMSPDLLKEARCATAHTAFGTLDLEIT